jgi:hypothetical protein
MVYVNSKKTQICAWIGLNCEKFGGVGSFGTSSPDGLFFFRFVVEDTSTLKSSSALKNTGSFIMARQMKI